MSQGKTILLIDEAMRAEARERRADRVAMIKAMEDEIRELHGVIEKLTLRVDILEAGVAPETSGETK
jgi:hypothetical protein